jgi:alanyl-tRNA synthetase
MNDLRTLARELPAQGVSVAVLASESGGRASLVVSCAADSGVKAGDLLRKLLPLISGKGGGDPTLAQGGGAANPAQLAALLEAARAELGQPAGT